MAANLSSFWVASTSPGWESPIHTQWCVDHTQGPLPLLSCTLLSFASSSSQSPPYTAPVPFPLEFQMVQWSVGVGGGVQGQNKGGSWVRISTFAIQHNLPEHTALCSLQGPHYSVWCNVQKQRYSVICWITNYWIIILSTKIAIAMNDHSRLSQGIHFCRIQQQRRSLL